MILSWICTEMVLSMPWGILSHLWSTESKISVTFAGLIQWKQNHQQDQKSTVQNSAGTQLSVPSCFPFSDIASLGKVVTEGLAPLLYQVVISVNLLSTFRTIHWNHSFLKSEDRKIERLICTCMLLAGFTHTWPFPKEGQPIYAMLQSRCSYRYEYTHFVDPETGITVCLSDTPSTALVLGTVGLQNEMTLFPVFELNRQVDASCQKSASPAVPNGYKQISVIWGRNDQLCQS